MKIHWVNPNCQNSEPTKWTVSISAILWQPSIPKYLVKGIQDNNSVLSFEIDYFDFPSEIFEILGALAATFRLLENFRLFPIFSAQNCLFLNQK